MRRKECEGTDEYRRSNEDIQSGQPGDAGRFGEDCEGYEVRRLVTGNGSDLDWGGLCE